MKHHCLVAALALLATACTTRPASNQEEGSAPAMSRISVSGNHFQC